MGQTKAYKPQIKMQYNAPNRQQQQQQQLPECIKLKAIVNFLTEVILSIHLSNVCLCFSLCFGGCHK